VLDGFWAHVARVISYCMLYISEFLHLLPYWNLLNPEREAQRFPCCVFSGQDFCQLNLEKLSLCVERCDDTVPTIGFTSEQVSVGDNLITLYDVGGGARIRDIWRNYFADVHGMVYVVDSSQPQRLDESRTAVETVFKDPLIGGKPCLVYCIWLFCCFYTIYMVALESWAV